MRKVLAVITALMLAAIVFVPAMGYTIGPQGKTNYTINSAERVNYTIGSGIPAHEMVYSEEVAEHNPTYSITSTPMPYSFKLGAMAKYSINTGINATKNVLVLGGYKSSALGTSEMVGKGLILPTEPENATEQAVAPAAKPVASNVIDLTKGEGNIIKTNATANVTATNATANVTATNATANVTATNATANVTVPAPVAAKLSIKGMVKDENQTGLAGWKIELATSKHELIANTNTSANGNYSFSDLNPGNYIVTEVLPTGWTAVTSGDNQYGITLKDKEIIQDFVNKKTNTTAPK
jgi:hypothetical protein